MARRVFEPLKHPPRVGDFVKDGNGVLRRVGKVTKKKDDYEIEYENGGKARWKGDNIIIVSRDEGRDKTAGEPNMRYGLM